MPSVPEAVRRTPSRVVLVRHGQSTFNARQCYQGCSDEPVLTESGAATAALTGRHLARLRFDLVITSPLRRAHQTATIIRTAFGDAPPLEVSPDLREIALGAWEGMPIEAVREQFPESWRIWRDRPHELQMPATDGTMFRPLEALFKRARRFWRRFLALHGGKTALLLTHGSTSRALIVTATGLGMEQFQSFENSNCGITILEFPEGSNTAVLEAWNLTAHLGERTPKLKQGKRGVRALLFAGEQPAEAVRWRLHALGPDFLCRAADPRSALVAAALLGQSGEVIPSDAPTCWDQKVRMHLRANGQPGTVATGVFVGPGEVLSAWLARVLQLENGRRPWKPFGTAVLHYPAPDRVPVLQTLHPVACPEPQS